MLCGLAKMCFGNRLGVKINETISEEILYAQQYGALILEAGPLDDFTEIGQTIGGYAIAYKKEKAGLAEAYAAYEAPLEKVFPTRAKAMGEVHSAPLYKNNIRIRPAVRFTRPNVVIPVFPGTNCEYDTARAFERAGAKNQYGHHPKLKHSGYRGKHPAAEKRHRKRADDRHPRRLLGRRRAGGLR